MDHSLLRSKAEGCTIQKHIVSAAAAAAAAASAAAAVWLNCPGHMSAAAGATVAAAAWHNIYVPVTGLLLLGIT